METSIFAFGVAYISETRNYLFVFCCIHKAKK